MNEKFRLAGMIGVIAALIVIAIFRPEMTKVWESLIVILAALFGVPLARKGIRRQMAIAKGQNPDDDDGLKFTWDEIHALICGIGDGVGWNKAETITSIIEPKTQSLANILAREAWYYKFGYGIGKMLWVPAITAAAIAISNAI